MTFLPILCYKFYYLCLAVCVFFSLLVEKMYPTENMRHEAYILSNVIDLKLRGTKVVFTRVGLHPGVALVSTK